MAKPFIITTAPQEQNLGSGSLAIILASLIAMYKYLYNNQIKARALIDQSTVGYCYYKPMEKSRVF